MTTSDGRRTSGSGDEWGTPLWLFDYLDAEFGFTFDAAAAEWNAKVDSWTSDGLNAEWPVGPVWLNPPFSLCKEFTEKAASHHGVVVVLLPVRSDMPWWHNAIAQAAEIRFICGRPAFVPHPDKAIPRSGNRPTFNTMLAIFDPSVDRGKGTRIGESIQAPRNRRDLALTGQTRLIRKTETPTAAATAKSAPSPQPTPQSSDR